MKKGSLIKKLNSQKEAIEYLRLKNFLLFRDFKTKNKEGISIIYRRYHEYACIIENNIYEVIL